MITTVKIKKDTYGVITQTYKAGLYVAIYKKGSYPSIQDQMCLNVKEEDYHGDIRSGKFFGGTFKILDEVSSRLSTQR